jgi:hypothetical protein
LHLQVEFSKQTTIMRLKTLISILLFTSISLFSQKQQFIGLSFNGLATTDSKLSTGFGATYENQLTKHHGFEIELNYRTKIESDYFTIPTLNISNQLIEFRESYLNLPIMYKFYSNIVNLSTGISFDYFVGGRAITHLENLKMNYDRNPKLNTDWNFKISKNINLSPKFILEPEIQFNPIFNYNYSYYGGVIKLKYKL